MKRLTLIATALAASFCNVDLGPKASDPGHFSLASEAQARRQSGVSFSVFYSSLRPYGHWAQYRPYGYVFVPSVGRHWRPYTDGRWVHSARYGWVWDSYEPFGWATFHYGWWDFDPHYGWFWVPGYEWAPSWVVWRQSDDFIGWAPMPARYVWGRPYLEISIGWRDDYWRSPDPWCFTRSRDIGDRHASRVIVPVRQNITYIDRSTTVYNTTIVNNTIINNGPDVAAVERQSGAQVARAEVNAVAEPPPVTAADAGPSEAAKGDAVVVNAFIPEDQPKISESEVIAAPAQDAIPAALATEAPVLEPTVPGPATPEAAAAPAPEPVSTPAPVSTPEPVPAPETLPAPDNGPAAVDAGPTPETPAPEASAPQMDPGIAVGEPNPATPMPTPDIPREEPVPQSEPAPMDSRVNEPPAPEPVPEAIPEPQPEMAPPEPTYSAPEPAPEPVPEAAPQPDYSAPAPAPDYSAPAPEPMPEAAPEPTYSAPEPMPEPAPQPEYSAPAPEPMPEPAPAPEPPPPPPPEPAPAPDAVPPPG